MQKVICNCGKEMKCSTQGVIVLCLTPMEYELWNADELTCPDCSNKVISRFGEQPFMRHYETGFSERVNNLRNMFPGLFREWSTN